MAEELAIIRNPNVGNYDGLSYAALYFDVELIDGKSALQILRLDHEKALGMLRKVSRLQELNGRGVVVDRDRENNTSVFVRANF